MSMVRTRIRFVALSTMLAVVVAVIGGRSLSQRPPPPAGVVIITLDTTRADRLAAYGFMSGSTPSIDRLARSGVVFEQAMTTAPLTLPAHTSLFTGLLPPRHGVRDNADLPLDPSHVTLAELLRARGVETGAFVGSAVLDADRGLSDGFDEYNTGGDGSDRTLQRSADAVMNEAIRWLEGRGGSPFFLWTHLYDPHRPYDAPEPHRSAAADPYSAEIAFVDAQIGRLLNSLERRGMLDDTLIIVVADHGESLGEHGERDHGIFVYDAVMRVPLIIKAPRTAPGRIAGLVRITDLMPTVLDFFGVPPPSVDGVSLAGVLARRQPLPELEAYTESLYPRHFGWSPLVSLRAGRYKFIDAPKPELYDLERDPFEERNVIHDRPSIAAVMRSRLARITALEDAHADRRSDIADAGVAERLASLGYVGRMQGRSVPGDTPLPDAKDHIAAFEAARGGAALVPPRSSTAPRGPR